LKFQIQTQALKRREFYVGEPCYLPSNCVYLTHLGLPKSREEVCFVVSHNLSVNEMNGDGKICFLNTCLIGKSVSFCTLSCSPIVDVEGISCR
jgi:hypothetical protein